MSFPTSLDDLTTNNDVTDGVSVIQAADIDTLNVAVDALQTKVGVNSSAVATSLDYKLAHKGPFASGVTVFNTTLTATNTFQDLDLSGTVGAQAALVFLEVAASAGPTGFALKPKGYGGAYTLHHNASSTGDGGGCGSAIMEGDGHFCYLTAWTNSSGVVQIASTHNNVTFTVKVVGYVAF